MTWEESAEFVRQSIESHDRQLGELFEYQAQTAGMMRVSNTRMDALTVRLDDFIATSQLNLDRLAQAMLGLTEHAVDHSKRITRLEGERE